MIKERKIAFMPSFLGGLVKLKFIYSEKATKFCEIFTLLLTVHSRSKCLVWVKKCCHIWLDQNFDPSLLTKKLWPFYMRMKQFFFFFSKKKFQNGRLKKSLFSKIANSQKFFAKISWIGPWVSRIE